MGGEGCLFGDRCNPPGINRDETSVIRVQHMPTTSAIGFKQLEYKSDEKQPRDKGESNDSDPTMENESAELIEWQRKEAQAVLEG
jgi:hypothetical protein